MLLEEVENLDRCTRLRRDVVCDGQHPLVASTSTGRVHLKEAAHSRRMAAMVRRRRSPQGRR